VSSSRKRKQRPPAPPRPPSAQALGGALAANAARKPVNLVALVVALVVPIAVGLPVFVAVLVAAVVYAAAAARTLFDPVETERITALHEGRSERQP
jgi:hypothetical protein